MSKLKSIIYLTQSDYTTLSNGGTVTKNGHTLTGIDEDCIYITTDQASVEDLTGILPVAHGGTGKNTLLSGQVLIGNGTNAITSKAIASTITNDSNTLPSTAAVYNSALLKSGGTMTGVLTVLGNQYADGYNGALNMNNSDIYGLNSIYTTDSADNAGEGIHFYRDSTHVDTLWINGGDILFVPNRTLGTATTKANSEKVARLPASITASRAVYTDGTTGELAISSVTATELGYLDGVTSSIQTQLNNKAAANAKITIAGNEVSLGGSLTAATLTSSLGLSNALHFIGITSTALTDGSTAATLTAKSTNSLSKTTGFVDGDVVMDGDQLREYVWSGSTWRLLGITTSTAYTQPTSTATNTWIAQVSQGTDGKITATTGSLDTSGPWSGNAGTANKLAASKTIWGQSFDGSANVTGNMTDVGNQIKLLSGQSEVQFLTSSGGAANGKFGKLGLNTTYANVDFTNYILDVNGKARIGALDGGQHVINGNVQLNSQSGSYNEGLRINRSTTGYANIYLGGTRSSTSGNQTGGWWIGTLSTPADATSNGDAITNTVFTISNNNTSDTFSIKGTRGATIGTNSGWAIKPRLAIGTSYNTSYTLYVNGTTYQNGNLNMGDMGTPSSYPATGNKITWSGGTDGAEIYYYIASADTGRLIFNTKDDANCLIGFAYAGAIKAYMANSTPSYYPATTNTGSIGTSDYKWENMYAITFNGNLSGDATSAGKWTTARTLTIGNTGKSVDGSGAVSWSLAEIGAAAVDHGTHVTTATVQSALGISSSGSGSKALTEKGTFVTFGTSNLTIGKTSSTAMAGDTTVTNVAISANVTTDVNYPIVFATSNKNTTAAKEEGLQKSGAKFYFNPHTGNVVSTLFNNLTLTAATTGFTIAGGTTSKTLTVAGTVTINTPTQWGIVYGGASGAYTSTAAGTSGQYLKSNGNAAPTWATFSASTVGLSNVTNDAQIPKSIGTTKGDIIYFDGNASPKRLAIGTNGEVLKIVSGIPSWETDNNDDTKNTAGSTNSNSKLYLIGAASQAANPQTYSDAHVFETNGAFSAKTLGVNADTDDDKVTLQWNSTDNSLDFVFA